MDILLVALHVMSNLVWIGTIASVGWLISAAAGQADPARGRLVAESALALYRRAAVPAFIASFTFGVLRLAVDPAAYMQLHWFHGKLTFALGVIALHHVIGAKAKRAAAGSMQAGKAALSL